MSEKTEQPGEARDEKREPLLKRLKKWFAGQVEEIEATDRGLDRRRKELDEKNASGTRRTDGRI